MPLAVSLDEYRYAAEREPERPERWHEWVLVDENEIVLKVFSEREPAARHLNDLFDDAPELIDRLRIVVINEGRVVADEWPRGGSPFERAGALAKTLSRVEVEDAQLPAIIRSHYLRGELGRSTIASEERRSVELWWWTHGGEYEPVGLLIDRADEGWWQLLLDGRSRGLTLDQLYARIAQTMRGLGDDRWTVEKVAEIAHATANGRSPTNELGPAGACVEAQLELASALHVTEPLGRAWP